MFVLKLELLFLATVSKGVFYFIKRSRGKELELLNLRILPNVIVEKTKRNTSHICTLYCKNRKRRCLNFTVVKTHD